MHIPFRLFWLFILINCSVVKACPVQPNICMAINGFTDQKHDSAIVVIPFEYKQSALYHSFTMEVMDSVIGILLNNASVTLSIEGFTHVDEGNDTISYYLSLNRALFIRDYVLGRGIDSSRIFSVKGLGKAKPLYHGTNKQGIIRNCRAEIRLNYPPPPLKPVIADKDEDGIPDANDECPEIFGELTFHGCPNKDAVIVPFENQLAALNTFNYKVLDSVVNLLKQDPSVTISIEGHAYKAEGTKTVCDALSKDRADIVRNYLLSRYIADTRIVSVKSFGNLRPLNAGKDLREIIRNSRTEIILVRH